MKVAIVYNRNMSNVINKFGMQNKEIYNPATIKKVSKALEDGGHNVEAIDGDMHVIERIENFMPRILEGERMGIVFNMAYGIQGESRYTHIPSMLEMLGIPYVGSSPSGHALALDKVITKIILQKHNVPTPNFWVFSDPFDDLEAVQYPAIIKPKMEAVSYGLSIVHNSDQLKEAIDNIIKEFNQPALVEQFIRGREFAIGLLGNNPIESFPVLEIDLENNPDAIQTLENKSSNPRQKICPADLPDEKSKEMTQLSVKAFKALQLRDFARVDIRMDENGNIFILEINSMASLGGTSSYPYAASKVGYDFKALVNKILDVAALRYFTSTEFPADEIQNYRKVPLNIRIRGFVRNRQSNIENLLKQMVNINTYVRNVEGVNSLAGLVIKHLSILGFHYQVFSQVEVGNIHFFTNSDNEEYDILLLGNLDNANKLSDHEYFTESEQKLYGTGIWENKGGLIVMIAALQSLRFVKLIKKIKIGILLTSDDNLQGKFAKNVVKRISSSAKYVLGLHGAFLNGGLVTSRSGAAVYHCQMNLIKTDNAAYVAVASSLFSKLISNWSDFSDAENGLVISPHNLQLESNITEPYAHGSVRLSVRFNDSEQMKLIDTKIKKVIPKKYKNVIYFQIEGGERRPSMIRSEKVEFLWKIIRNIANKLDINLREEHRWSSADICFVDQSKYTIDGMGPIGSKPSNKSEYILRHSLLERTLLLAMSLYNLVEKH
ncbi:MAG: ATP-grasp domain-containing protein [Candidatus Marinimicrobia bacterium]|nr:ATP-grasp domain-containing protein [Candidatus Neomarinimicrobiota bacterium]